MTPGIWYGVMAFSASVFIISKEAEKLASPGEKVLIVERPTRK
jgi:hypothetical protein